MCRFCFILALITSTLIFPLRQGADARPGDPSLATLAERALVAGDLHLARELFEKWLEADPSDYVSWYNFACTQALLNDTLAALTTLEHACTAGWSDSAWTADDPDLRMLQPHPRFQTVLKRMSAAASLVKSRSQTEERLYIGRTTLAPCLLVRSDGYDPDLMEPRPLIILLHDRGQDMEDIRTLVDRMALADVLFAIPRAPYPVEEARGGFEYWPRDLALTGEPEASSSARSMTASWYSELVQEIAQIERVNLDQVILIGYAQGGAAALLAALEDATPWHGVASLAGYLPESHRNKEAFAELKQEGTHLFLGHGVQDREITKSETALIHDLCQEAGVTVTYRMYPAEHELSDEMILDLSEWVEEQLGRTGTETQQQ